MMKMSMSILALITATAGVMGTALGNGAAAVPASAAAAPPAFWEWTRTPTMGWNSWDCYGAGINEEQALANADYMAKNLKAHGYDLVTIDIQWYEPTAHTETYKRGAILETDANGRLLPAPNRFPSTKETGSFKPIGDKLHAMGLRFGLHLMRGIPRQAVDRDNALILGTEKLKEGGIHAADIADKHNVCNWNTDMYGVDMSKPGAQEYYDSVFAQMASWDLDFVKVDDLSSPYHGAEIEAIRKAIDRSGRKIVFSTSPGATPVNQGAHVEMNANQWRISGDFWDSWGALQGQFARLDAWTRFRGPGHFPDADMLPVGRLQMWRNETTDMPGRLTNFTHDEQYTLITLWSIARSPLIIGGNLPSDDDFTLALLTNDEVLAVDQHSTNNRQLSHEGNLYVWAADAEDSGAKYVALFNAPPAPPGRGRRGGPPASAPATSPEAAEVSVKAGDLGFKSIRTARDLWKHEEMSLADTGMLSVSLNPHCSAIFKVEGDK